MATFQVSNASQLSSAILKARGGDKIVLAGGNYGKLDLNASKSSHKHVKFDSTVTITAASDKNPPVFNDMYLNGVSNLRIEGVTFDYAPGRSASNKPFTIERSDKVVITDSLFDGQVSSGKGSGQGLRVRNSSNITVEDNDAVDLYNGFSFSKVQGLTVRGNDISGIANDFLTFGEIRKGLIEKNAMHSMKTDPKTGHKDGIQFWTTSGEGPSSDIVIRSNKLDVFADRTHGIFMGNNEARGGNKNMFYKNILIENNDFKVGHSHGITVEHGIGVTVRQNTVLQHKDAGSKNAHIPLITVSVASEDVKILNNKVASVQNTQKSGWTISGNDTTHTNLLHWAGSYQGTTSSVRGDSNQVASKTASAQDTWSSSSTTTEQKTTTAPEPEKVETTKPAPENTSTNTSTETKNTESAPKIEASALDGKITVMQAGGTFRSNDGVSGDRVDVLKELDFGRGDTLVFNKYESGTFRDKSGGNIPGVDVLVADDVVLAQVGCRSAPRSGACRPCRGSPSGARRRAGCRPTGSRSAAAPPRPPSPARCPRPPPSARRGGRGSAATARRRAGP
jgi:hypothetical protein